MSPSLIGRVVRCCGPEDKKIMSIVHSKKVFFQCVDVWPLYDFTVSIQVLEDKHKATTKFEQTVLVQ